MSLGEGLRPDPGALKARLRPGGRERLLEVMGARAWGLLPGLEPRPQGSLQAMTRVSRGAVGRAKSSQRFCCAWPGPPPGPAGLLAWREGSDLER